MFDHLTTSEVGKAHAAADYLLNHQDHLKLEPPVCVKLDSLRADLAVEQEDRQQLARK